MNLPESFANGLSLARPSSLLIAALSFALLVSATACKRTGSGEAGGNDSAQGGDKVAGETSSTPPFSTREPERYQARVLFKNSLGEQTAAPPETSAGTSFETFIARDGEKRREEYELSPGLKVYDLSLPSGRFLLLPSRKLYAEIRPGASPLFPPNTPAGAAEDFSPDRLINDSGALARYEKLGPEEIGGRATMKYRVRLAGDGAKDAGAGLESLIWIDERLGMPVRSETSQRGGTLSAQAVMELQDIREEVDQSLFELPGDYRKVEPRELAAQISSARKGAEGAAAK
jgi:hypothetical protein